MNQPDQIVRRLPMSSVQRRLYLQCQLPGGDRAYHLLLVARVRGHFNMASAQAFAQRIIKRHESLRCSFRMDNGEFICEVHDQVHCAFTVINGKQSDLEDIVEAFDTPFDLAVAPLLRVVILRLNEADCIVLVVCHHLIYDGYSAGILAREIQDELSGRGLEPIERNYADFVHWERQFSQSAAYGEQRDFWLQQYRRAPQRLALRTDFTPPSGKSFAGDYLIGYLDSKGLKEFSRSQGATLFMTLLAAFYCVLHKLTGQEEITLGTLVSPRESGNFHNVIGLFANTLPLTQTLDPKTSFAAFLSRVRTMVHQAMLHADFPFEHLVGHLPFLEKGVRNPLFDVVFNFERVARGRVETFGGVSVEPLDIFAKVSMFDLAIDLVEYEDQVRFKVEYATTLFKEHTLQGLMDAYFGIIEQVCRQPDIGVEDLSLISETTRNRILHFNDTARPLKSDRTFLDIWKQQVGLYADNPALRLNGQETTYAQIEERANRLAHWLISAGIDEGAVVAVAVDRSPEWVSSLLATWKAGGVYLPLDASHPPQRLAHQLADSQAAFVITQEHLRKSFTGFPGVVTLEELANDLAGRQKTDPGRRPQATQPAYIIYTSGSTGTPKGVLVEHLAISVHLDALKGIYKLVPDDNVLQFSSLTFDASLEQILVTLASGACLVLLDAKLKDPRSILDLLVSEEVTVAEFPPAYLQDLLAVLNPYALQKIRLVVSGGDVLTPSLAAEIINVLPISAQLFNFYGPTEATMAATVYQVPRDLKRFQSWPSLPIGKPLPNTRVYVLDDKQQLLPVGVSGELCIAGNRLARGYLNRAELTEEKFMHIDQLGNLERVYRTGDWARWLPDGNIEFLGRLDRQVQLRGYRIELGEIEQTLLRHRDVREAVVVNNSDDGRDSLAAFVAPRAQSTLNSRGLYDWLRQSLPDYMIPSSFTLLDAIPKNAEGKLDRQALGPSIDSAPLDARETPLDSLEWDIWHMWRKILKAPHIGRNDIFFQIGGNSLSAIQLMAEVKNNYGVDLPLSLVLRSPTIAVLADFLRDAGKTAAHSCVVSLNPEGTGPPIVLIPGLGGNVLDLYELAAHLDRRFPCYGLQHPWDSHTFGDSDGIEELAGRYLRELEAAISLEGCILVGHSFGGYVAYELARILQQRNRPAQSLILLDVAAPLGPQATDGFTLSEHDLLELTLLTLLGSPEGSLGASPDTPEGPLDEYARALMVLKEAKRIPDSLSVEMFHRYIETVAERAAAFSRYAPASRIGTDIDLYRAREIENTHGFDREDGNWADFTCAAFSLRWSPGDHFSMVKGRHAADLAEHIQSRISKPLPGPK